MPGPDERGNADNARLSRGRRLSMTVFLAAAALAMAVVLLLCREDAEVRLAAIQLYRGGLEAEASGESAVLQYGDALRLLPHFSEARLRLALYRDRRLGDAAAMEDYRLALANPALPDPVADAVGQRLLFLDLVASGELESPAAALQDLTLSSGIPSTEFRGRLSPALSARLLLAGVDTAAYASAWRQRQGARILERRAWRADRLWWLWMRVRCPAEPDREALWQAGPDGVWLLLEDRTAVAN